MKRICLYGLGFCTAAIFTLTSCVTLPAEEETKDHFHVQNGQLKRNNDAWTLRGFKVAGLGASNGAFSAMIPALARIAESGGNAVVFDLAGWNADGTALDPAAVETVRILADRTKEQRMAAVVDVLGDRREDGAFCEAAAVTAAKALRGIGKAIYIIDGPNAAGLAASFKKHAPGLVVVSRAGGDMNLADVPPQGVAEKPVLVRRHILDPAAEQAHFVLGGDAGDYLALDEAMKTAVERAPWTPDNAVLSAEEREAGFIALHNGKDFDGWWFFGDNPNGFKVNEAGDIEWVEKGAGAIISRDRYGDFVLRLDFKIEQDGNSGIYLRAPRAARQSKIGMEFQIRGDHGVPPGDDQTGAIYVVVPPLVNASRPAEEWNELEIMLQGPHMKATLNGQIVQDTNLDDYEELKYRLRRGFIGLQDHNNQVSFRKVRIKPL